MWKEISDTDFRLDLRFSDEEPPLAFLRVFRNPGPNGEWEWSVSGRKPEHDDRPYFCRTGWENDPTDAKESVLDATHDIITNAKHFLDAVCLDASKRHVDVMTN